MGKSISRWFRRLGGGETAKTPEAARRRKPGRGAHWPDKDTILADRSLLECEPAIKYLLFGFDHSSEQASDICRWLGECARNSASVSDAFEEQGNAGRQAMLTDLLVSVVQNTIDQSQGQPLRLGLSSGFDSRALLYALRRLDQPVATFTFGQPGDLDFEVSRELSVRLGLDTWLIDTSKAAWSLRLAEDYVAGGAQDLVVSPKWFIGPIILENLAGTRELSGFGNDAWTGGSMNSNPVSSWPDAVTAYCKGTDPFGFQGLIEADARDFLPQEPWADPELVSPYMQMKLASREYQRVRPARFGSPTSILFPFEDESWLGFWLNRPEDDLVGQRLYLDFVRGLGAEEFVELDVCDSSYRPDLRLQRLRHYFPPNGRASSDAGVAVPFNPTIHFCVNACYANNSNFRALVDNSLARLRKRGIFRLDFIDAVLRGFLDHDLTAIRHIKGLLTIDMLEETGRLKERRADSNPGSPSRAQS